LKIRDYDWESNGGAYTRLYNYLLNNKINIFSIKTRHKIKPFAIVEQFYFRKLEVYQNAKRLSIYIYTLLKRFPAEERFGLTNQLRRAITSVPINIAEGFGRFSSKEKAHFIEIAYGSLTEVLCELELSLDENYISNEEFLEAENQITQIAKQLSGLHNSVVRNGDYKYKDKEN
jgi:S23 ribosomal